MKIRNIFLFFIGLIILIIAGVFLFYQLSLKPASSFLEDTAEEIEYKIDVPTGETVHAVARDLKVHGIINNETSMYFYARLHDFVLKAGTYHVKNTMSIPDLIAILESGVQEYVKVIIPEGFTISKIGAILEKNKIVNAIEFHKAANNKELLAKYGIPANNFEGFLFPDTYFLTENMTAESVVTLMVDTFFERINNIAELSDQKPSELYRTLVLASIVQREYRVKEEAPIIASVFTNRLKHNIGLYSCATVEYIITEILGQPHPDVITTQGPDADTKIDNPYNTYLWAGLPPGPISNPGLIAIEAAANPAKTDFYYFRLVDIEKGIHIFTHDFDEHKEIGTELYTKPIGGTY